MKRMKHEQHGFHHPVNGTEEATMRGNGWVDDEPEPVIEAALADGQPEERTKRPYNRKAK